jgi:hypothetical protein
VTGFGFLPTVQRGWLSITFANLLSRAEISRVILLMAADEINSVIDKE